MRLKTLLAAMALIASVPTVHAGIVNPFSTEGDFKSALVGGTAWIDDLETGLAAPDTGTQAIPIGLNFVAAGESDRSGALYGDNAISSTALNGRKSHGAGTNYWDGGGTPAQGEATFVIEFASAVTAFGFYGSDIGDFVASCTSGHDTSGPDDTCATSSAQDDVLRIRIVLSDNTSEDFTVKGGKSGGLEEFWGFTEGTQGIKRVEFRNLTGGADGQGFDYFMVGDAKPTERVPEPAGLVLVGLGLLGAASIKRKRQ